MQRDYYSLHAHSEFSNIKVIDSINRYSRSIDYAWQLNLAGVAMTEHDCVSGAIKYIDAFEKKLKTEWKNAYPEQEYPGFAEAAKVFNFKPILGNEIYLTPESMNKDNTDKTAFYHLILLAKDKEGFKQIRQLSSAAWGRSWMKGILRTPTYPSDLEKYVKGEHLICSTACLGGYLASTVNRILAGESNLKVILDNWLSRMEKLFGKGNFFIELQPNKGDINTDQIVFNKYVLANYWGKYPFIITTDAHYLNAEERELHKWFLNSKSSGDREVDEFYRYAYFMSKEEIVSMMDYATAEQLEEMFENTLKIADTVQVYTLEAPKVLAKVEYEHAAEYEEDLDIFNDVDEEAYPVFAEYLKSKDEAAHYLMELIAHGYIEKYNDKWKTQDYYARLEEELWTIKEVGAKINQPMEDYFITMSKMIDLMWNEGNSIVGPSRGSAGTLLINYLLGITQMDPIQMDLPYVWRFLHPSRPDLPDIDVDTESDKRSQVFNAVRNYFKGLGGDLIHICTFGTEGTKSAINTAGRGLNIDPDEISYITSMVKNERGFDWSLHDCYYGNGDDRKPVAAFIEEMNKYPELWKLAQCIEGLVTRLGVHASGVVALNSDVTDYNSIMRTSAGQIVSAYDLHDSERAGLVKYDFLTVSALDRIRVAMNYLLEDGVWKWQGSLRETYNKYLAPNVINFDSKEMWDDADGGDITSLFQFDTPVGSQAMKDIKPHSLAELAIANSLMRLMSDNGGELPLKIYVKHKTAPSLWYYEMQECGLNSEEIAVLEKYLKGKYGVADSQEVLMQLVMDPQISGFDMKEANRLRKTVAKKNFREIDAVKELFYTKGAEAHTRKVLLDYVWEHCVSLQLGYSFSTIHTTGYSIIAVQEMNLAFFYPRIYWNCACLSVDSSAINDQDFYNLIDEGVIEEEVEDEESNNGDAVKRVQNKMNYSKLAAALDKFKKVTTIKLPDINLSRLGFTPNAKENTILYGLKGISRITEPVIKEIIANRPFTSLQDFINKTTSRVVTKDKIINLIKCGAFDAIEHKTRREILNEYLYSQCGAKKKLTLQNANMLIDENLLDNTDATEMYKLTKELRKHRDSQKLWYKGDEIMVPASKRIIWLRLISDSGIKPLALTVDGESHKVISSDSWDAVYERYMTQLRSYIKTHHDELLERLNQALFNHELEKYGGNRNELDWELDSLNFYFSGHPLKNIAASLPYISLTKVPDLVENATDGFFVIKGVQVPKMKLFTLAGTVLDKDSTKGTVTLQCPSGVVILKMYKDLYALYSQVINNEQGQVIDDTYWQKGEHLLVTGISRGSTFVPKVYKNTPLKSVERIVIDNQYRFIRLQVKTESKA